MDERVTIVACTNCTRSGHLEHGGDRWWCAWCQAWTDVSFELVENCVVDRAKSIPILTNSSHSIQRQALRIPPGWDIVINTLSDEDPPTEQVKVDSYWGGSDIFYAVNRHRRLAIDIETRA